jgi:hypothetical protein
MSVRSAIGVMAVLGFVCGVSEYARAQEQPGIGVVSTLIGEATVARGTTTQLLALKTRDDVFMQDRISTKERSLVHVLMGGKALLTVRELSVLTITEEGGRATVDLQSGKVGLAVVRQRMKPGEIIEIRTPHSVAAVRGTVLVVEIIPGSGSQNQPDIATGSTNIHLLHGKLDVSLAGNSKGLPVQLESLQSVTASRLGLGVVRPLSPEAVTAVTANLKMNAPSRRPGPSESLVAGIGEKQRTLAVATATALTNGRPERIKAMRVSGNGVAEKKGKVSIAVTDRDPVGFVADMGDSPGGGNMSGLGAGGNGGGNGNGRGHGLGLDLVGGSGSILGRANSFGGVSGSGGGISFGGGNGSGGGSFGGNFLAPILPRLQLKKDN